MEQRLLNGIRDIKSDKVVRVKGLTSRTPIDCYDATCRRFISLRYDYTLKKILHNQMRNNFVIGLALPNRNRNANIAFVSQFNRNVRGKNLVNFQNCDQNENGEDQMMDRGRRPNYSDDPVSRKSLICELYRGLTNRLGQMQIASSWNFCTVKERKFQDGKCNNIDQTEALIQYLSGKHFY